MAVGVSGDKFYGSQLVSTSSKRVVKIDEIVTTPPVTISLTKLQCLVEDGYQVPLVSTGQEVNLSKCGQCVVEDHILKQISLGGDVSLIQSGQTFIVDNTKYTLEIYKGQLVDIKVEKLTY